MTSPFGRRARPSRRGRCPWGPSSWTSDEANHRSAHNQRELLQDPRRTPRWCHHPGGLPLLELAPDRCGALRDPGALRDGARGRSSSRGSRRSSTPPTTPRPGASLRLRGPRPPAAHHRPEVIAGVRPGGGGRTLRGFFQKRRRRIGASSLRRRRRRETGGSANGGMNGRANGSFGPGGVGKSLDESWPGDGPGRRGARGRALA